MKNKFQKYSSIVHVKALWEKLYQNNPQLSFYQSYAWNFWLEKNLHVHPFAQAKAEYWVFEDRVIIPWVFEHKKRRVTLLGDASPSDYASFIFAQSDAHLIASALLAALEELKDYAVSLSKISEQNSLSSVLKTLNEQHQITYTHKQTICMALRTQTDTPLFYDSLSKSNRNNYRTAVNRITRHQKWTYEIKLHEGCIPAQEAAVLYRLYRQRREDCDNRPWFIKYFFRYAKQVLRALHLYCPLDILTEYAKQNPVFLASIYINGELAAFCEGAHGIFERSVSIARVATAGKYYHYSPGFILFVELMNQIRDRIFVFDLTRGTEDYKRKLGCREHKLNFYSHVKIKER